MMHAPGDTDVLCPERQEILLYSINSLLKDTLNNGHLSINDACCYPNIILCVLVPIK